MQCTLSLIENLKNIQKLSFCIILSSIVDQDIVADTSLVTVQFAEDNRKFSIRLSIKPNDQSIFHSEVLFIPEDVTIEIESFDINSISATVTRSETEGHIRFSVSYKLLPNSGINLSGSPVPTDWVLTDVQALILACNKCGARLSSENRPLLSARALPTGLFDSVSRS